MSVNFANRFFSVTLFTLASIVTQSACSQVGQYCQFDNEAIANNDNLRAATLQTTHYRNIKLSAYKYIHAILEK